MALASCLQLKDTYAATHTVLALFNSLLSTTQLMLMQPAPAGSTATTANCALIKHCSKL